MKTPQAVVDTLTYVNYAVNRERAPHIPVEVFIKNYPNGAALEAKYQADRAIAKAQATAFVAWAFLER